MTLTAMDGDNLARPVKADTVKKHFVENEKLDKSQT